MGAVTRAKKNIDSNEEITLKTTLSLGIGFPCWMANFKHLPKTIHGKKKRVY